jgi:CHAT domain-containing protein/Tfp pilus assembly protein PilF
MKSYFTLKRVGMLIGVLLSLSFPSSAVAAPMLQEDDPQAQAERLFNEGDEFFQSGQYQDALEKYEAALPLYQDAADRSGEALCLLSIGYVKNELADHDGALKAYHQSLPIWEEIGNQNGLAATLNNIALIYFENLEQYQKAIIYFEKELDVLQNMGDKIEEAETLSDLALVYEDLGQYKQALSYYEKELVILRELGEREDEGIRLNKIGTIHHQLGQYSQALEVLQQAVKIAQESGDRQREGTRLSNIGIIYSSLGQYKTALGYYEQARVIAVEIADLDALGNRLNNIGAVYEATGEYKKALAYFQEALDLHQETENQEQIAVTYNNIGAIHKNLGQYSTALEYYLQALEISKIIEDPNLQASVYNNIGTVYDSLGQYSQAQEYLEQALEIRQQIDDPAGQAVTLSNLASIYRYRGQFARALQYLKQALELGQKIGDRAGEGTTLNNISQVHESLGQYMEAIRYSQQALSISQEIGDLASEAASYNNLATTYSLLGQSEQALTYFQRALETSQEVGDRAFEATTLNNIGVIHRNFNNDEQALEYFQNSLSIATEIGNRRGEGLALNNIGATYADSGQHSQALEYYQKALDVAQEIGDKSQIGIRLNNIGSIYLEVGEFQQAMEYFLTALEIAREVGDQAGEVTRLTNIAFLYEQQGKRDQAITHYQQAIKIRESMQSAITVEELKASFAAEQGSAYQRLIDLLWEEGRFEESFNYAERARARAFLDQVAGGTLDIRAGANSDLLRREQAIRDEINALRNQLIRLRSRPQIEWDTAVIVAAQNDLADRETEYARLLTEIKLQSPEVASLVSVDVPPLADIQSLLDPNTTLVEYFVMEERTLVFIITSDSFETIAADVNRDELSQTIQDFRHFASLGDPHPASLRQLHAWLIAPLRDKLKTPVIGLIPHNVLHYVPFAALTDGQRYLDEEYSLFTLPSASVLRFIQEKRKPQANMILAFGNPAITEPGLAPLQFAEEEVEVIANLFESQPLTGDSATESALRSHASNAGIIHLAAHGQYNSSNPLFSAIYLAKDEQQDGRLEVNEIYSLDLTQATDLVVLSACETQVGEISAGDEVVGMTRAFLYAGTPTVIASLWSVDDEATALLMEHFYTRLREGMGKAQALQAAQNEVRQEYPHPYYWAAFVLTGDAGLYAQPGNVDRVSSIEGTRYLLFIGLCFFGFLAILAGGIAWRRRKKKVSL